MSYLLLIIILIGLYLICVAYGVIFRHDTIDEKTFCLAITMAILIPIIVFVFITPNISVEGRHKEYSNIVSSNGNISQVMIEYLVYDNVYYDYKQNNEYEIHSIEYYPETIYLNSGETINNILDESGITGDKIDFEDKDGKEYTILIPEFHFSFYEQLNSIGIFDKLCYSLIFISSILVIIRKLKQQ